MIQALTLAPEPVTSSVDALWSHGFRYSLHKQGAQGVILGCTEICMSLNEQVTDVPLIDKTGIHAESAVQWMLS
ncbi:MAG: hypothetical protein P8X74_15105 [Reinekea sp.]